MPNGQNNFDHATNMAGQLGGKNSVHSQIAFHDTMILQLQGQLEEMESRHYEAISKLESNVKEIFKRLQIPEK